MSTATMSSLIDSGVGSQGATQQGRDKWSKASNAPAKVQLEMVWEVPPESASSIPTRSDFAVAKYSKIKPLNAALLDSYTEGYQRTTTLFFGRIVSNPDDLPAFQQPLGYNMTYNAMATGNGNALHRHNSVEVFIALDAPFEIAYGSKGEFKCRLQPWDMVACPAEVIHSYKNIGQDGGQILTFLMGKPAITWAPGVVAEARKNGAICDDSGILLSHSPKKATPPKMYFEPEERTSLSRQTTAESVTPASRQTTGESLASQETLGRQTTGDTIATQDTLKTETTLNDSDLAEAMKRAEGLQAKVADELIVGAGALDKFVYRYSERLSRALHLSSSEGTMRVGWIDLAPARAFTPEGEEDTLVIVLGGSVICQDRHYPHLDVIKQPTFMTAGTQGAVLLVARSHLPHNLDFFFDADISA